MKVKHFDLFDADCPPMSVGAQLPLVLVDGEVLSSGGKIATPALWRKIEEVTAPDSSRIAAR